MRSIHINVFVFVLLFMTASCHNKNEKLSDYLNKIDKSLSIEYNNNKKFVVFNIETCPICVKKTIEVINNSKSENIIVVVVSPLKKNYISFINRITNKSVKTFHDKGGLLFKSKFYSGEPGYFIQKNDSSTTLFEFDTNINFSELSDTL